MAGEKEKKKTRKGAPFSHLANNNHKATSASLARSLLHLRSTMAAERGGFLRVEVNLVDVDAVKADPAAGSDDGDDDDEVLRAMTRATTTNTTTVSERQEKLVGALSSSASSLHRSFHRARLAEGPAICGAAGRLPTGTRVGRGFRPGRLVSHSPDGGQRFEWACRGGILTHMLHAQKHGFVSSVVIVMSASHPPSSSSHQSTAPKKAVAHVSLSVPQRLWQRGRIETKDAKTRAAVVALFSHARCDWADEMSTVATTTPVVAVAGCGENKNNKNTTSRSSSSLSSSSATTAAAAAAGFCGVLGCTTHDSRSGSRRGTLQSVLENLRPPRPDPPPIFPQFPGYPSPGDLPEDALDIVAAHLDARAGGASTHTTTNYAPP